MLRTRRLCICAFFLGCIFVFGAWFCMGDMWIELRKIMLQFPALSYFKGKSGSVADILIGNAIGAYSVSFGFFVEYFGQKKEIKTELRKVYLRLRRRCFEKIFHEENAYDSENDEVIEILDYISENMYLIENYRPLSLRAKVKIRSILIRIKSKITGKEQNSMYLHDDVYALIASVILDIYRYFLFIATEQMWLKEAKTGMDICSDILKRSETDQLKKDEFKVYYVTMRHLKKAHMNRLVSRFPYNSKLGVYFMDKNEVYKKIYSINTKLSNDVSVPIVLDYCFKVFPEHYIVKDKEILYDKKDYEIKDILLNDEIRKELESLEID